MNVAAVTMSSFLTEIGAFFTQSMTWMSDALDIVVASPALTALVLAMPICG